MMFSSLLHQQVATQVWSDSQYTACQVQQDTACFMFVTQVIEFATQVLGGPLQTCAFAADW